MDLPDIIVGELPEPVDLHCEEEVLQDEEEEQQVHGQTSEDLYEVSICCGLCHQPIKFVCKATISAVRSLQELLFGPLNFVCCRCVRDKKLNHGG